MSYSVGSQLVLRPGWASRYKAPGTACRAPTGGARLARWAPHEARGKQGKPFETQGKAAGLGSLCGNFKVTSSAAEAALNMRDLRHG
jgi:hypothetical protein